ncbi:hypothetical protein [Pseudomonas turukhanskensis]|uniref:Uncharacterized protein n=1 Tax=Pseudomonas turukhanskensis TaxID=1806536 RepID=A0A9W6NFA0_9PSED|nr:hypothetical protein [Pseudomonas turukhanskensis]GLK89469.1 hypothetical protein GCM10017655_25310 [Pseudomonas turukhanskensis]
MNMLHASLNRFAARSLLALAVTAGLQQANAFSNNHIIPDGQVPHWAGFAFTDYTELTNCAAIRLTPRITISARDCLSTDYSRLYFPADLSYVGGYTGVNYDGPDSNHAELGNLSLYLSDPLGPGANILSYEEEKRALVDGNETLTIGAPMVLYGGTVAPTFDARKVATSASYVNRIGPVGARPLIFRSIPKYRQLEPERFNPSVSNALFSADALDFFAQRKLSDEQINSMVLLTAGLQNDAGDGFSTPITSDDTGSGIFYQAPDGTRALVGITSTTTVHTRLSHYWPWVFNTMIAHNIRDDAITFSQRVLGTGRWGSNDRKGKIGEIYVYDNPYTKDVEFFRLVGLGPDQRYWYFPTHKGNNQYWQYMGTDLPSFEEATQPMRTWGENDRLGQLGDTYRYANPYTKEIEYFKLVRLGPDQRYWHFPTNKSNNHYWQYLGTSWPKPTTGTSSF